MTGGFGVFPNVPLALALVVRQGTRSYNAAMTNHDIPDKDMGQFQTLVDIVERLRAPGGCPWDREQTHESLKRNLVEEAYETMEAIDEGSPQLLAEELGDLLVQVAFHSDIAREAGGVRSLDVLTHINRKLVRRHPHVFSDTSVQDAREVERNWERIKAEEREAKGERQSVVDGLSEGLAGPGLCPADPGPGGQVRVRVGGHIRGPGQGE